LLENQDFSRVVWHFVDSTARLAGAKLGN
jgi:hypothetical protein